MDWKECIRQTIAKSVKEDKSLVRSAREIAKLKVESADALPSHLYIGVISLLYDALREYLECVALEHGYKVYNHECYAAFLKEVINCSREADQFDEIRKVRNGINYYGKKVSREEADAIIRAIRQLIKKFEKEVK